MQDISSKTNTTAQACPGCTDGLKTDGKWPSGLPRLVPHLACDMTGKVKHSLAVRLWREGIRTRAALVAA